MKQQNIVLYVLRLSLTLLLITGVVAAALAGVNSITAPLIEQHKNEKTQAAIEAVLPGGGTPVESFMDTTGTVRTVYESDSGYAVEVAPIGFSAEITMMVGVDHEGKVLGISVISHTETAGLGAVAAASNSAGESFRGQFIGMEGMLSVDKDGGEVQAITGATITSRAVVEGVNAAVACVENLG